jgi:hypothetical protein
MKCIAACGNAGALVAKEGRLCAMQMLRNQTAFINSLSQYYVQYSTSGCLNDFRAQLF